jgi:transposase
MKVARAG